MRQFLLLTLLFVCGLKYAEDRSDGIDRRTMHHKVMCGYQGWFRCAGDKGTKDNLPRLKGEFYWRQFSTAADLSVDMAYLAMFDELDEATPIFNVTNSLPQPGRFVTMKRCLQTDICV